MIETLHNLIVGNICADPQFVDAANNDYHLRMGSPCINVGEAWLRVNMPRSAV